MLDLTHPFGLTNMYYHLLPRLTYPDAEAQHVLSERDLMHLHKNRTNISGVIWHSLGNPINEQLVNRRINSGFYIYDCITT